MATEKLTPTYDVTIMDTDGNELGRARVSNCSTPTAARRLVLATLVITIKEVGNSAAVEFNSNQADLLK